MLELALRSYLNIKPPDCTVTGATEKRVSFDYQTHDCSSVPLIHHLIVCLHSAASSLTLYYGLHSSLYTVQSTERMS
ncbi:hypothetical protein EB796_013848 [Bugula neritina]|uniref:Uncharacterized protein n=1 Tax=Bugula neritina TaxID=10212 RepID=A0A7J7JQ97_BUGNE|nr:hypothetical protein EB796_013848 [Bugula neritina]